MTDKELTELRKKVKKKEEQKKIDDEKAKLREKLNEGLPIVKLKKIGKGLIKRFMK